MAERYNKLYSLPHNLYAAGSPVIIAAGALLKDNQTGKVLAQLKFRSISEGSINALKVLVTGYDVSGAEVCREEHQYLDLKLKRNESVGAKEAIPLPDRSIRSIEVQVLAVFFSDGRRYFAEEQVWEALPEQQHLRSRLFDRELIRQYKLDTSDKSENVPMEYKDLWLCACGEVNTEEEDKCCSCGMELEDLKYRLNVDILLEEKNERLMQEAKLAAERESNRERSTKIIKRVLMVVLPLLILAGAAWFFVSRSQQKEADYEMAGVLFAAEKYTEAAQAYEALGEYKDSVTMAQRARNILSETGNYEKALKFLENGRYDDAYNAFFAMGDYENSKELAKEAHYLKAISLAQSGQYDEAKALFRELAGYKDASELINCFTSTLIQEESSYNAECEGPLVSSYTYDDSGRIATKTEHFSAYEGMQDRVLQYSWNDDGSYSVTEGSTVREYDKWGVLISENGESKYTYDHGFYDDGSLYYVCSYSAEDMGFISETVYDEQGNPIRYTNTDGSVSTTTNEYDARGNLTKQENFDTEGAFLDRTSFEYDAEGKLKRSTYMDLNNVTAVTNYNYEVKFAPELAK